MFLSGKSLLQFWGHLQGVFFLSFFQFNRSQRKDFNTETLFKLRFYWLYGSHGPPVLLDHHASEQGWRSQCSFTGQRWVERKFGVGTCQSLRLSAAASCKLSLRQNAASTRLYGKLSVQSHISAHQNTTKTCDIHFRKAGDSWCILGMKIKPIHHNNTVQIHYTQ